LQTEVKDLRQDVGVLQEEVKDLRQDVSELQADMKGLQTEVKDLRQDVGSLQSDMKNVQTNMRNLQMDMETMVCPQIQLLAESYVPAAKKYEEAAAQIDGMQADVALIKKVVSGHSQKLQALV
ncbi:MAG: hypothetical protein HFI68_11580, partial [Lachnospiraceae bacterium]|nr:hypothetical protein [Lachnospiraceae bacterium]